jgi:hypothetical protein
MPDQAQKQTLLQLQKQYAIGKIYSDLAEYIDKDAFHAIIKDMNKLQLNMKEYNANDIAAINQKLRNKLSAILDTENLRTYNKAVYDKVFYCMLLLTYYWPLNNQEVEDDVTYSQCPISMSTITEQKILLSTGHQLHPEALTEYVRFAQNKNSFKDPVSRKELNHRDTARLPVIAANLPLTEEQKHKHISQARAEGFFVGILSPIILSVILSMFSALVFTIPPIVILPLLMLVPFFTMPIGVFAGAVLKKRELAKQEQERLIFEADKTEFDITLEAIQESALRQHQNIRPVTHDAPLKPQSSTAELCNKLSIVIHPEPQPEEKAPESEAELREKKRQAWLDSVANKHKSERAAAPSASMRLA